MDNPVIHSILEEEAQAQLQIQAAREKAQALIRETKERLKQEEEKARKEAQAHLEACLQEAAELTARAERKAEEEAMSGRAVLRAASSRKMPQAAEAVLSYLR